MERRDPTEPARSLFVRCGVLGLVAGAATAAAWATLVIRTGTLFDVLAPGIGVAVGAAIRYAPGPRGVSFTESNVKALGIVASVVTLGSILGGKLLVLSGLVERNFGQAATWETIRQPFFTSLIGLRGLYALIGVVAAYAIVTGGVGTARRAGS